MYEELSDKISNLIKENNPSLCGKCAFPDGNAVRRNTGTHDKANAVRSEFIRDVDKIMNCPFFPRYADKTQVFSLYKNDDITRRSLHIQYVSRIARTIGKALGLNLELIEAIALGHDIGHTTFGHSGEHVLNKIYFENTGRHFFHNLHSVRVLDKIFPLNITLQTLDGVLCHDGETELSVYSPRPIKDFGEFDEIIEKCYTENGYIKKLIPSTLEGCVVRISDIIAYLGKDRQDAKKTKTICENEFCPSIIGNYNAEIINNLTVNVIENSYGKNYIKLDDEHFAALKQAKKENYDKIYLNDSSDKIDSALENVMRKIYGKIVTDLKEENKDSPVYRHHINYIENQYYKRKSPYTCTDIPQIAVDYIASMTDDYFIDFYNNFFPDEKIKIDYKGYFSKD